MERVEMKRVIRIAMILLAMVAMPAVAQQKAYKDSIVVARDGSGDYRTIQEAVESVRAFMDYTVNIYIKPGTYKEKLIVPSWVRNVQFIGEDVNTTVITYDDHANINKMGTFRTYTVKVEGTGITFKNLTIENNAAQLGQAVALHTEGDKLKFINCRFLGNQDTIYTGKERTRLYFGDCYIEGTTDFIFGPSTALFERCTICSKRDSYVTAASTPADVEYGYIFKDCKLIAAEGVTKVYLGRPWRPYAATVFMNCELGSHILPVGWHNWKNPDNEKTARYAEYQNTGAGADTSQRVSWSRQLTAKEAKQYTLENIFKDFSQWNPFEK
jgi:pectinesterase